MDYYPQPRPVLYGTSGEEAPPQTQTAPVRTGPPRFPPAPPLAGDAPDPYYRPAAKLTNVYQRGAMVLPLLYALASAYSLLQIILGTTEFAGSVMGRIVLSGEIVISLILIVTLVRLGGLIRIGRRAHTLVLRHISSGEYLLAVSLVALHVSAGMAFAQWQSPALWVAVAVMLYLLRPSMMKRYGRRAFLEFRSDLGRFGSRHPIDRTHSWLPYLPYVSEKDTLRPGQAVRITDGPFANFEGIVDSIDQEKGKVRVRVSMFGRETPIELDFLRVERLV